MRLSSSTVGRSLPGTLFDAKVFGRSGESIYPGEVVNIKSRESHTTLGIKNRLDHTSQGPAVLDITRRIMILSQHSASTDNSVHEHQRKI